jgi:hypothetical protein
MLIDLTPQERTLLQEILAKELNALVGEIAHTDRREYRRRLRVRHGEIEAIAFHLAVEAAVPIDVGPLG